MTPVNELTNKTAVVISPPKDLWEPIQKIRKAHQKEYTFRRWMPHITMLFPFRPKDEFEQLAEQFSTVCQDIDPFQVVLSEFRFFKHDSNNFTLWLAPEPNEKIIDLQNQLWQIVPECSHVRRHSGGFVPHLSVGQIRGHQKLEKLQQSLQSNWQPVSFMLSDISFIWRNDKPDDVFRVGLTVPLGE